MRLKNLLLDIWSILPTSLDIQIPSMAVWASDELSQHGNPPCLRLPMAWWLPVPALQGFSIPCKTWRASQVALVVKNPPANAGDVRDKRLIPGLGRWPRAGHGNPLQYSCLENPMDRRAWQTTVHGVTKSRTWLRRLRTCAPTNTRIQDQTKNTSGFQDGP